MYRNFEVDLGYGRDGRLCYRQETRLRRLLQHHTGVDAVRPCRACTSRVSKCQKIDTMTGKFYMRKEHWSPGL